MGYGMGKERGGAHGAGRSKGRGGAHGIRKPERRSGATSASGPAPPFPLPARARLRPGARPPRGPDGGTGSRGRRGLGLPLFAPPPHLRADDSVPKGPEGAPCPLNSSSDAPRPPRPRSGWSAAGPSGRVSVWPRVRPSVRARPQRESGPRRGDGAARPAPARRPGRQEPPSPSASPGPVALGRPLGREPPLPTPGRPALPWPGLAPSGGALRALSSAERMGGQGSAPLRAQRWRAGGLCRSRAQGRGARCPPQGTGHSCWGQGGRTLRGGRDSRLATSSKTSRGQKPRAATCRCFLPPGSDQAPGSGGGRRAAGVAAPSPGEAQPVRLRPWSLHRREV